MVEPSDTKKEKPDSGFYSPLAMKAGGRKAAVAALESLENDLECLLADLEERIPAFEAILAEQEQGKFRGRPPSQIKKDLSIMRTLEMISYLRRLRAACRANLRACAARRKELRL